MTFTLPGSPIYDIASTTSSVIASVKDPMVLAISVFLGFLVIQFLVDLIGRRVSLTPPSQQPPMM